MQTEIENALRSVARQCRAEIIAKTKGKPKPQHDHIITTILDFYAKKITALSPGRFSAKLWLSYFVHLIDKEVNNG